MFHAKPSNPLQGQATIAGWTVLTGDPKLVPADFSRAAAGAAHAPGGDDDGDDWDDDDGQPTLGPRTGDGSAKRTGDIPGDGSGDGSVSGDSDAAKLVDLCDDVVQQYARGDRNKLDSIQLLCATLDEADASDALDAWLDKLQRADASKQRAVRAGAGDAAPPLRSSTRGARVAEHPRRQREPSGAASAAAADRRARVAPAAADPDPDASSGSDSSNDSGRARGGSQGRRAGFDILKTPFARQDIAARPVSAHVLKTIELRLNYSLDLKLSKTGIASDPNAPPFPQDQWEVVLRDGVVDFNKVLSARFPSEIQELATHHIGGSDGPAIVFGSGAKCTVQSRTDWAECWDMYEAFVVYLFPHRVHELRRYRTHVLGLFSSRALEFHSAVVQADIAMRSEVALRNDLALDDFQELIFVWQCFVDARGAHAASASAPAAATPSPARKSKNRGANTSGEYCINWNKGQCTYKHCRHLHACSSCGARGHPVNKHPADSSGSGAASGSAVEPDSRSSRRA